MSGTDQRTAYAGACDAATRALLVACTLICATTSASAQQTLKIATWNLQWLMTTETFDRLAPHCETEYERGGERAIPCDIVQPPERSMRRTPEDFARMRHYARQLNADVVALQEVDGREAAERVFPGYAFCFTGRGHVQNVGFAIRRGIDFHCVDYPALGMDGNGMRWGADLTLYPGTHRELRLLSVHLKSGCARQPLNSRKEECRQLAAQVPVLERWIDDRAGERVPFAVAGDFNRRFANERARARDQRGRLVAMWPELDDGDPPEADLNSVTADAPYIRCSSSERYRAYIDHIALSRTLAAWALPGSLERIVYSDSDARRFRLSDHCPLAVTLRMP